MLHLPVSENRVLQFAARFEQMPTGDWAWFAHDFSPGLLVTDAERSDLIARHAAIILRTAKVQRWWLPLAFVLTLVLVIVMHGNVPDWSGPAIFVAPLLWIFSEWRRADRLPLAVTSGRMAVLPPRGLASGARARLRALPLSIPLLMMAVGTALLVRLWYDGALIADQSGLALAVGVILFGAVILWLRRG